MNGCFSPSTDYHQEGNKFHGCAWKIAYPDFLTATMEYFLLLWFFQLGHPRTACKVSQTILLRLRRQHRTSGSGDVLGGKVVTEEGASQSSTAHDEFTVV